MKTKNTRFVAVLLVVSLVLTAGCLKCELILDLAKNGSGSLALNYSISEQAITQINAMTLLKDRLSQISGQASETPDIDKSDINLFLNPNEDAIRKRFGRYASNGIYVDKIRVITRGSHRYVDLRLMFDDIAKVATADFYPEHGITVAKQDDGNYMIHRAPEIPPGSANADVWKNPIAVKTIETILNGFKFVVRINTPGRILSANTNEKSTRSAIWTFDFDRDPAALTKLQEKEFVVIFDGQNSNITSVRLVPKDSATANQ